MWARLLRSGLLRARLLGVLRLLGSLLERGLLWCLLRSGLWRLLLRDMRGHLLLRSGLLLRDVLLLWQLLFGRGVLS